jgi:ElaB/YqjD/DUF883 family membrane-anchored ribosome-binding protein
MTKQRLYQSFEETTGGNAAMERESVKRSERKARTKAKTAAETTHDTAPSAGQAIQAGAQNIQDRTRDLGRQAEVWAEEARERETAELRAHAHAIERVTYSDFERGYSGKIEKASRKIGHLIGRVRRVQGEDIVSGAKGFVREHPNSIFGALAAGFVLGKLLRR